MAGALHARRIGDSGSLAATQLIVAGLLQPLFIVQNRDRRPVLLCKHRQMSRLLDLMVFSSGWIDVYSSPNHTSCAPLYAGLQDLAIQRS